MFFLFENLRPITIKETKIKYMFKGWRSVRSCIRRRRMMFFIIMLSADVERV